jgi:hypothetical protein
MTRPKRPPVPSTYQGPGDLEGKDPLAFPPVPRDEDVIVDPATVAALDGAIDKDAADANIAYKNWAKRGVRFNGEATLKYASAIERHGLSGNVVHVEQLAPREADFPVITLSACPTWQLFQEHLYKLWNGEEASFKWTIRRGTGFPIYARGTLNLRESPEQRAVFQKRVSDAMSQGQVTQMPAPYHAQPQPQQAQQKGLSREELLAAMAELRSSIVSEVKGAEPPPADQGRIVKQVIQDPRYGSVEVEMRVIKQPVYIEGVGWGTTEQMVPVQGPMAPPPGNSYTMPPANQPHAPPGYPGHPGALGGYPGAAPQPAPAPQPMYMSPPQPVVVQQGSNAEMVRLMERMERVVERALQQQAPPAAPAAPQQYPVPPGMRLVPEEHARPQAQQPPQQQNFVQQVEQLAQGVDAFSRLSSRLGGGFAGPKAVSAALATADAAPEPPLYFVEAGPMRIPYNRSGETLDWVTAAACNIDNLVGLVKDGIKDAATTIADVRKRESDEKVQRLEYENQRMHMLLSGNVITVPQPTAEQVQAEQAQARRAAEDADYRRRLDAEQDLLARQEDRRAAAASLSHSVVDHTPPVAPAPAVVVAPSPSSEPMLETAPTEPAPAPQESGSMPPPEVASPEETSAHGGLEPASEGRGQECAQPVL